jgi:hypothetical protein
VDGTLQTIGGLHAADADTTGWSDRDYDGLPDWVDPYPDEAANNTVSWQWLSWVDGTEREVVGLGAGDDDPTGWSDRDEDGLPDWADPYPDDSENNTIYWQGEFVVDAMILSLSGTYRADQDWSDADGDQLPDFLDPYPNDFTNNTATWSGSVLVDGALEELSLTLPASSLSEDTDGDMIPDVADPYPTDETNNTSFWHGGTFNVDGHDQYLSGNGQAYATDADDVDSDGIPDFADPYPYDETNTRPPPDPAMPVESEISADVSTAAEAVSQPAPTVSVPVPAMDVPATVVEVPPPVAGLSSPPTATPPPVAPPPAATPPPTAPVLDDEALLSLLSTGSLPENSPPGQITTSGSFTVATATTAAVNAEAAQIITEIAELALRPRAHHPEADAMVLQSIVL